MAQWAAFSGIVAFVLVALLVLARLSQVSSDYAVSSDDPVSGGDGVSRGETVSPDLQEGRGDETEVGSEARHDREHAVGPIGSGEPDAIEDQDGDGRSRSLPSGVLLANVALSQGLFCLLVVGGAWYTRVPATALGVRATESSIGLPALGVGLGVGIGLYLANELGSRGANAAGIETPDALRESLAPDSTRGWVVLLGGVLPIIAVFEELLFRAALVGALSAGFGLSPWLLAVGSSIAFALGHGAQGSVGMVATGGLGFVLAGTFVLTGSLLVVVVAHYLVNALEFVVHERSSV